MGSPKRLSAVLDDAEKSGQLNLRTDQLRAALPHASESALNQSLHRQQRRGRIVRLSRGSAHWLIVPLSHAAAGAPPPQAWLDCYMSKTLGIDYYVTLLSAAEIYGASPYGVMVTQVMVEHRRRQIRVGQHEVVFHTCKQITKMPTGWHSTPEGRLRVATPELTALELIQRAYLVGGITRVAQVLVALWPSCSPQAMTVALNAVNEVPTAQRLGALLTLHNQDLLQSCVKKWLNNRTLRVIALDTARRPNQDHPIDTTFKVRLGEHKKDANA